MTKRFLTSVMALMLTLAMLLPMTSVALAADITEASDIEAQEELIKEQIANLVKEDNGIVLFSGKVSARDLYSYTLLDRISGQMNADYAAAEWSGNFNVPNDFRNGELRIAWACGGNSWQETSSVFRATTSSEQNTLLYARGATAQIYKFNNNNSWNYVSNGTWNLSIKPYSQCHGMYNFLFTLYVVKEM